MSAQVMWVVMVVAVLAAGSGCAPAVTEPSPPARLTSGLIATGSSGTGAALPTTTAPITYPLAEPSAEDAVTAVTRAVPSLTPAPLLPARLPPAVGVEPVERAITDLAGRLGAEPGEIELVTVYSEDFPSGDLGCLLPKEAPRAEGLVMGQEIVLAAGEAEYVYRVSGGLMVFCGER